MNPTGTPDILSLARQARDIAAANRDLSRVSTEMATGVKDDLVAATGGDPSRLYAIERDIARADTRASTLALAQARTEATQNAMNAVQTFAAENRRVT
ncbi:MAG: hypothetical protein AAFU55_01055 [Pseudomonadota bacterium]